MSAPHPSQIWWSAAELAEAAMPDMPATKRGVNVLIERGGWKAQSAHARKRAGRGGGWEFHWQLLPLRARQRLLREAAIAQERAPARSAQTDDDRAARHAAFEALPEAAKAEARFRLRVVQAVMASTRSGLTRSQAVTQ
ncbi:DNA-binding protein, partial [Profundibacterium mesophilum]